MRALVGVRKTERKYSAVVCPHFSNLKVRSGLDVALPAATHTDVHSAVWLRVKFFHIVVVRQRGKKRYSGSSFNGLQRVKYRRPLGEGGPR